MTITLLDLPVEIRLDIYSRLFSSGIAVVDGGLQEECATLLPAKAAVQQLRSCSGQLLRVCRTIWREAEPVLYDNTRFYTLVQAFAGKLPTTLANGTPFAPKVRHLTWQMNCDLMKHFYEDDFKVDGHDIARLDSLELRCQAEAWRGMSCGAWWDQEVFVRGRSQMIQYAQRLQKLMSENGTGEVDLVENRLDLGKGRVALKLSRKRQPRSEHVNVICFRVRQQCSDGI